MQPTQPAGDCRAAAIVVSALFTYCSRFARTISQIKRASVAVLHGITTNELVIDTSTTHISNDTNPVSKVSTPTLVSA